MIAALAEAGAIAADHPFAPDQIQPASLDLRLGAVAYRVRASFLPGPGTTVAQRIAELKLHEFSLAGGAVLETGCVYIVPLIERLALPADIAGRHQSEKLDRPARCLHPRHRRRDARLRSRRRRLSRPALCRDQSEDFSGSGARRHAAVANAPAPRRRRARCRGAARAARARAAGRPRRGGHGRRRRGEHRSFRHCRAARRCRERRRHRRLSRQAAHRRHRSRAPRRLRRRRFLGADRRARRSRA